MMRASSFGRCASAKMISERRYAGSACTTHACQQTLKALTVVFPRDLNMTFQNRDSTCARCQQTLNTSIGVLLSAVF